MQRRPIPTPTLPSKGRVGVGYPPEGQDKSLYLSPFKGEIKRGMG